MSVFRHIDRMIRKSRKLNAVVVILLLASLVSGCGLTVVREQSTTPNGIPCEKLGVGCFYYMSGGNYKQCNIIRDKTDCSDSPNSFYSYELNSTYHCTGGLICHKIATPTCPLTFTFDKPESEGLAWKVVDQLQDQNTTSEPAASTFTSKTSTTITASVNVDINVSADAAIAVIFASVHADVNASVSRTATTEVGNSFALTVPARLTAFGIYGIQEQITTGHLSSDATCTGAKHDYGTVKTYVPIGPGWCVWLSNQTPCAEVS